MIFVTDIMGKNLLLAESNNTVEITKKIEYPNTKTGIAFMIKYGVPPEDIPPENE